MAKAYFLRDGRPTDRTGWADKQRDPAYVRVAADGAGAGLFVSTVWLGVADGPTRPPEIFETRVFIDATQESLDSRRYATEAEARAGHAEMVAKWNA